MVVTSRGFASRPIRSRGSPPGTHFTCSTAMAAEHGLGVERPVVMIGGTARVWPRPPIWCRSQSELVSDSGGEAAECAAVGLFGVDAGVVELVSQIGVRA